MNRNEASKTIYALRALALFGIVTAHGTSVPDGFSLSSTIISGVYGSVGATGVGIFFTISGYLLCKGTSCEKTPLEFVKAKVKRLCPSWFISGVLTYLYVAIRKGGSIWGGVKYILGYQSFYWYMSVLMFLYILYYFVIRSRFRNSMSYVLAILNIVFVFVRPFITLIPVHLLYYVNPFAWCFFFSLGVIIADREESLININRYRYWVYFIALLLFVICVFDGGFSYFKWYYIPVETMIILAAIFMAYGMRERRLLKFIGAQSYATYLWHNLPWAGLIANLGNRIDFFLLVALRPFVVMGITITVLVVGWRISKRFLADMLYEIMTGVNNAFMPLRQGEK